MKTMSTNAKMESVISFRVSEKWLEAIDRWREKQPVKPSRSAVMVKAVEMYIALSEASAPSEGQSS
jgi:hypothetical protein